MTSKLIYWGTIGLAATSIVQMLSCGSMRRPIAALKPYTSWPHSRTNAPVLSKMKRRDPPCENVRLSPSVA